MYHIVIILAGPSIRKVATGMQWRTISSCYEWIQNEWKEGLVWWALDSFYWRLASSFSPNQKEVQIGKKQTLTTFHIYRQLLCCKWRLWLQPFLLIFFLDHCTVTRSNSWKCTWQACKHCKSAYFLIYQITIVIWNR